MQTPNWEKWSSIGTITASIIGFLGIFIGWYYSCQNSKSTDKSLDFTNRQVYLSESQNKREIQKRIDDSIADSEKSKKDDLKFQSQMQQQELLANANLDWVKKQTYLMKNQVKIYEEQLKLTQRQSDLFQNELKIKRSENYLKLRKMTNELGKSDIYFTNDTSLFFRYFASFEKRKETLNNINIILLKEISNLALFENDTIGDCWRQLNANTSMELDNLDTINKKIENIITDKGTVSNSKEIYDIFLKSFWGYRLTLSKKMSILNDFYNLYSENLSSFKSEVRGKSQIVGRKFNDDTLINILQKRINLRDRKD